MNAELSFVTPIAGWVVNSCWIILLSQFTLFRQQKFPNTSRFEEVVCRFGREKIPPIPTPGAGVLTGAITTPRRRRRRGEAGLPPSSEAAERGDRRSPERTPSAAAKAARAAADWVGLVNAHQTVLPIRTQKRISESARNFSVEVVICSGYLSFRFGKVLFRFSDQW